MNEDEMMISMGDDGVWGIKEEPYIVIEVSSKEEFEEINELLRLGKEYREILEEGVKNE